MTPPNNANPSPLEALSLEKFGGKTYPREKLTSVGITRVDLLPNNPNRVYWRLINESANNVRVSIDTNITSTSGWLLQANGGTIEVSFEDDGETVGYPVYAIAGIAANTVRSMEVIRE